MKLYDIRVPLKRANCWNFQIDKRNLDIAVSASSNRLFFYDFWLLFLSGAKRITIINVAHFLLSLRWGLFHVLVFFWVDPNTTAWEKGLVKCHVSASQVLNAPTY